MMNNSEILGQMLDRLQNMSTEEKQAMERRLIKLIEEDEEEDRLETISNNRAIGTLKAMLDNWNSLSPEQIARREKALRAKLKEIEEEEEDEMQTELPK